MDLEGLYLQRWAERIVERVGFERLEAMGRREREAYLAELAGQLAATPYETMALTMCVENIMRQNARPANSARERHSMGRVRELR